MTWPTDSEALAAVGRTARHLKTGRWTWSSADRYMQDPFDYSEAEAIMIAKACLFLGIPVTDTVTARAWLNLIERVARLEAAQMRRAAQ